MKIMQLSCSIGLLGILFSCGGNLEQMNKAEREDIRKRGDEITTITQQSLLSEVQLQMQAGGPQKAIAYCNVNAAAITNGIAQDQKVAISRISEKYRNTQNAASTYESDLMQLMDQHKQYDTLVQEEDKLIYYKTIRVGMPTCLKCHGEPTKDIDTGTLSVIDSLYPKDLARNYHFGDFRGLWKVEF